MTLKERLKICQNFKYYSRNRSVRHFFGEFCLDYFPRLLSDKQYICATWYRYFGKSLNLSNPKTYTEKLQWLKLYDHNPIYSLLVDKYRVKSWAASKIGEDYVLPVIAKFKDPEEIDIESLPDSFVLKCNHDCGGSIICKGKSDFDFDRALARIKKSFRRNYYRAAREWPYKNVKPLIFAEPFLCDSADKGNLIDYKFFCFDGVPKVMYVSCDRSGTPNTTFYDMDRKRLPIAFRDSSSTDLTPPPCVEDFEKMRSLASILSEGIPHVRVDFYLVDHHVFFGEMTFFHCAGWIPAKPDEWNSLLGSWINLENLRAR